MFPKRLSGIGRWWRWDSTGGAGVACFKRGRSGRTRAEWVARDCDGSGCSMTIRYMKGNEAEDGEELRCRKAR